MGDDTKFQFFIFLSVPLVDSTSAESISPVDACIEEERSTGAVIARASVTDPDGDMLTWTILDSSKGFEIGNFPQFLKLHSRLQITIYINLARYLILGISRGLQINYPRDR